MPLLAYNLTTSPLALAVGGITLPASSSPGARAKAMNVTAEFATLTTPDFTALQGQVALGVVEYEWTNFPEFDVTPLVIGSAQEDVVDIDLDLYADPTLGSDSNAGTSPAAPLKTFEALMNRLPIGYRRRLRIHLNIDPTTSAINTTKKVYTLSNQFLAFMFPECQGRNAESVFMEGGFTNELGDLTATGGTTSTLITNQNFTLDQYKGAFVHIVSGTGAGQQAVIRGNTAGPNSVITPEIAFSPAPDATSVYRIGYCNVELQFQQNVDWIAPPQSLICKGIKFKYAGTTAGVTMFVGAQLGPSSGGVFQTFLCEYDFNSGTQKAAFRVRGSGKFESDGVNSHWVGPNTPIVAGNLVSGCYFHDGSGIGTNLGGWWLGGGSLIKNFVQLVAQSQSYWATMAGTIENTQVFDGGAIRFNIGGSSAVRGRIRLVTGTGLTIQNMGMLQGNNGVGLDLVEFSDITGDLVVVQTMSRAFLGDITVAGVNTGVGLKVQTGGQARVQANTLLSGTAGVIQVDGVPLTLAQANAAPFSGTLSSNVDMTYPLVDPGTGQPLPITASGNIALTIGAGPETNTLPNPSFAGEMLTLSVAVAGGGTRTITAASAINRAGNTIMALVNLRDSINLKAMKVGAGLVWQVIDNDLATPLA